MPSGAKKRKAAKKKMVEGNNNNNYATHSNVPVNDQTMNGDDEPKQQPPLSEEGKQLESRSTVRSNVSESNPKKELNHDGENVQEGAVEEDFVHIEREDMKSLEDSSGKTSTTDNEKESTDSSSSSESSTSGSSDDESHVLEKVETSPPLDSNEQIDYAPQEVNSSIKKTEDFTDSDKIVILDYAIESDGGSSDDELRSIEKGKSVDSHKSMDSPHQEEIQVTDVVETSAEEFGSTIESDIDVEEKKVEKLGSTIESNIEVEEKKVEETASIDESHVLDENKPMDEIDKIAPPADAVRTEDSNHLVEETGSVLASINVPMLKKTVHVNGSASVDNSVTSCEAVEPVSNNNGEKSHLSVDEVAEVPSTMMDVQTENQVAQSGLNENGEKKDSVVVPMNEDESSLSLIAPNEERVESDNHECTDSQPLIDSARRTVQTTSWKNCCGIFELFKGRNP